MSALEDIQGGNGSDDHESKDELPYIKYLKVKKDVNGLTDTYMQRAWHRERKGTEYRKRLQTMTLKQYEMLLNDRYQPILLAIVHRMETKNITFSDAKAEVECARAELDLTKFADTLKRGEYQEYKNKRKHYLARLHSDEIYDGWIAEKKAAHAPLGAMTPSVLAGARRNNATLCRTAPVSEEASARECREA